MRTLTRWLLPAVTAALLAAALPGAAQARIYKYVKPDGTVVYTDKLSELPPKRRAHYNKMEREAARERRALERRIGKEELERREAEAERKALMQEQMAEEERRRRMEALDATLERVRERARRREVEKKKWQDRMKEARAEMNRLLKEFRETQQAYNSLATKADYTLLPGQGTEKRALKEKLEELEKELDEAIRQVQIVIPAEARKAGVPPGWLR